MKRTHSLRAMLALTLGLAAVPTLAQQAPRQKLSFGTGFVPITAKEYGITPHLRVARDLDPDQPRQLILDKYLPLIGNQTSTESCVGWSTAYYCYSYAVAKERRETPEEQLDPKFQFSPAFIWHQGNKGENAGMSLPLAFQILATQGCATLKEDPWDDKDFTSPPSDVAKARAIRFKARGAAFLFKGPSNGEPFDPDKMRKFLYQVQLPFVIGIDTYPDFSAVPHDPDFVYDTQETGKDHGHAITIIGYDADKKAFRMVNSWGPEWGDHGFLWLSDNFLIHHANVGLAQIPGGPVARDLTGVQKLIRYKGISLEPPTGLTAQKKTQKKSR